MELEFPDILLLILLLLPCACQNSSIGWLILARLTINLTFDVSEFMIVDLSLVSKNDNASDSGHKTSDNVMRYYAIGGLVMYGAMIVIYFLLIIEQYYATRRLGRQSRQHLENKTILFLYKCVQVGNDICLLLFCIEDDRALEEAIPFLVKPNLVVNWSTWVISLLSFLDIIIDGLEFLIALYLIFRSHFDGRVDPLPNMNVVHPNQVTIHDVEDDE